MNSHPLRPLLLPLLLLPLLCAATPSTADLIPITGRVVGPEGSAIGKGSVKLIPVLGSVERGLRQLEGHLRPEPEVVEKLRPDGRFRLTAQGPGLWIVEVHVPGHRVLEHWLQPLLEETALPTAKVEKAAELWVTVRDEAGRPLADASVSLERERVGRRGFGGSWRPRRLFQRTDDKGRARFHILAGQEVEVTAWTRRHLEGAGEARGGGRLEVRLTAGEERTFEVRTAAGKPAPEVLVVAGNGWTAGFTDDAGRFTVAGPPGELLPVGLYSDTVWDQGFQLPPRKRDGEGKLLEEPPVVFTLPTVRRLQGRVVDARDRSPIPQAFVWVGEAKEFAAWTGPGGLYTLTLPEALQNARLWVAAGGYLRDSLAAQASPELPTMVLQPAVDIRGRVVDEDGAPLEGIELRAMPEEFSGRRRGAQTSGTAWSGEDGGFRMAGMVPSARYTVKAREGGYAAVEETYVTPEPQAAAELLEIILPLGRRVAGVVVSIDEEPVAGAVVTLHRPVGGDMRAAMFRRFQGLEESPATADTDPEGRFELRDVAPGRYDLEVEAVGFAPLTTRGLEVPAGGGLIELGTVLLEPGMTLEGRVVDGDGQPLPEARVTAAEAGGMALRFAPPGPMEEGVDTDETGHFLLPDLKPGEPVDIHVQRDGYLRRSLPGVEIPQPEPLEIRLEPAGKISGRVVNDQDEPVANALLRLVVDGGGRRGGMVHSAAEPDGSFTFDNLESDNYTLMAMAQSLLPAEEQVLEVTAGKELSGVTLVLHRGATVEGRILSGVGSPVHGARVGIVESRTAVAMRRIFASAETDGDGRYRLEGVAPGPLSLEANHSEYSRAVRDLEVRPGTNRLDFTLEVGLAVAGRVVSSLGEPVAGAAVRLTGGRGFRNRQEGITGGDGSFRLPSVPVGTYQAVASKDGLVTLDEGVRVDVADGPVVGIELTLLPGVTITGQVTGLDFAALSAVQVRASQAGRGMTLGEVNYEGGYRIGPVSPGVWLVQAEVAATGEQLLETLTVEEGAVEVTLDLDFGAGHTLTGRVLRGGEPLTGVSVQLIGMTAGKAAQATTNFEGAFRLSGLVDDDYRVSVRDFASGLHHSEELSLSGDRDIEITLSGADLRGVVRSAADGGPLSRAQVRLERQDGDPAARVMTPSGTTNADGVFRFEALTEGTWLVRVTREGFAPAEQTIQMAGTAPLELDLTLQPTQGLQVQVLLPDGRSPDRVRVVLMDEQGNIVVSGRYRAGEAGLVHLDTAPVGTWWLQASTPGLGAARQRVEVPGPRVIVRLPDSGWLDLRVPALETEIPFATVMIRGSDGLPYGGDFSGGTTPDGSLLLRRGRIQQLPLPAGSWTVTVNTPDGRSWQGSAQIGGGGTVELVLE